MFKKAYKILAFSILILSIALALTAGLIVSAETPEYSLTITIPSDSDAGKIYLSINGEPEFEIQSGQVYTYAQGTNYKLRVEPLNGYQIKWYDTSGEEATPAYEGSFGEQNRAYVAKFVPAEYTIHYVDESQYEFRGTKSSKHVYGTATEIMNPNRAGYTLIGWELYDHEYTEGDRGRELGANIILGSRDYESDIWLKPIWKGNPFLVVRLDCVYDDNATYNLGECLGYQIFVGTMGEPARGSDGEATEYTGYHFMDDADIYDYDANRKTVSISDPDTEAGRAHLESMIDAIKANPALEGYNVVFRFYQANEYTVTTDLNAGEEVVTFEGEQPMPQTHLYNVNTSIPNPQRAGYTFLYWDVSVDGVHVENGYPGYTLLAKKYAGNVSLRAIWQANDYSINYNWNGKDETDSAAIGSLNSNFPSEYGSYTYATPITVPQPVRVGYTFAGWMVKAGDVTLYDTPVLNLPADVFTKYPMDLTLVAHWTPNVYKISFDGNGASEPHPNFINVVFDGAFDTSKVSIPKRFGYAFLGYYTAAEGGEQYISADGAATFPIWTLPQDVTLYAQWALLPMVEKPTFTVDYQNELILVEGGIPAGRYQFSVGEVVRDVLVTADSITVNGQASNVAGIPIPVEFFGQTVQVLIFGDGVTTSHNYDTLVIDARWDPTPTVDLTGLVAAMGLILFFQCVAIALLLIRSKRVKKTDSYYSFLPVTALAVKVTPDYALTAVVILGFLIVLFQVFLTYLLITSNLIPRGKNAEDEDEEEMQSGEEYIEETAEEYATEDDEPSAAQVFAETEALPYEDEEIEEYGEYAEDGSSESDIGSQGSSYEPIEELDIDEGDDIFAEDAEEASEASTGAFFGYDDEEELATGAPYYDEEVPFDINEGVHPSESEDDAE